MKKVGNKLFTIKDLVHQLELQKKESQSKLILQEDFVSYVIFLFLEENKEKRNRYLEIKFIPKGQRYGTFYAKKLE